MALKYAYSVTSGPTFSLGIFHLISARCLHEKISKRGNWDETVHSTQEKENPKDFFPSFETILYKLCIMKSENK